MRILHAIVLALWATAGAAAAQGNRAGDFDHYVMALSWSPAWCASEADNRDDRSQCEAGRTFVLHGLWPQHATGWPEFCRTTARDPSRAETAAVADLFGSAGAAFWQWKKHGRCAGLAARDYYALARRALAVVAEPGVFAQIDRDLRVAPRAVEEAFLEANPALTPDGVTVTCRDGLIREVRICLTRDLEPRRCGPDVRRDCPLPAAALLAP